MPLKSNDKQIRRNPDASPSQTVQFTILWNACIHCGACVAVCPLEAGFISPFDTIAEKETCHIACMACEKICPVTAIEPHYTHQDS